MYSRLIVVRHGETQWNVQGRIQGFGDSPLTEQGRAQAEKLGERLAREPIDAVYASDLGRVRQTLAPLLSRTGWNVTWDAAFRERSWGVLEGLTMEEITRDHPGSRHAMGSRDPHAKPEGGESKLDVHARLTTRFDRLVRESVGKLVLVVTHGGVLDVLHRHAAGVALDAKRTWGIGNATLNRLRWGAPGWSIELWNDASHL